MLLGELRLLENNRQRQDRRAQEAYPPLTELLRAPEEPAFPPPATPRSWSVSGGPVGGGSGLTPRTTTRPGASMSVEGGIHRGRRLRVDALLRAERSLPIAVAHLLRPHEDEEEALARLEELARERLGVPFAYLFHPAKG